MDVGGQLVSRYSDEQKRESVRRARELLARFDAQDAAQPARDLMPELELWRSAEENDRLIRYGLSLAVTDPNGERWRAEAETFARECEQEVANRRAREAEIIRQRQEAEREMTELPEYLRDVLAAVVAELRRQMRDEIQTAVGELRAELTIQRAADNSKILDLPPLPLRRSSGAA
jgi:hypothetical protein